MDGVMARRGLIRKLHGVFEIRAASGREVADLVSDFTSLIAADTIHPQPRRAREGDNAEFVLRLQLLGEHMQRLANNGDAIRALNRTAIIQQQNDIQWPTRLPPDRRRLEREAKQ